MCNPTTCGRLRAQGDVDRERGLVEGRGMTITHGSRSALIILAVLACAYALSWLAAILTPLALALFLTVMVDGFARYLSRHVRWMPEWASLPVAILLTVVTTVVVVFIVGGNAAGFVAQLGGFAPRLNRLIADIAGQFGAAAPPTVQQLVNQLNPTRYIGDLAHWLQSFSGGAVYVLIYVGFMIASRQGLMRKVQALFPDARERDDAVDVFDRIRLGLERYLWIQTVTGLLIAVGSFFAMTLVRLDNAMFWAFLIFIACYIPVLGGIIGTVLPPMFALVQFPSWWQAAALFVALQVIMFGIGSVLLPRMQRDSLNIDPVVVLLSLAFWGAIWGVAGMFLSTPLTVMAIIILAQFPSTRWIAIVLSGDGAPERAAGEAPARTQALPSPRAQPAI